MTNMRGDAEPVYNAVLHPPADNRTRILHALRAEPGLSKIGLARRLGLASSTISPLVGELIEAELLVTGDFEPSTGGRPAQRLSLNPLWPLMMGIDLGETTARFGVLNLQGRLLISEQQPLSRSHGRVELEPLLHAASDLARRHPVAGIGVAVPGRLDQATGTVLRAANLGWHDLPLRARIEQTLDLPVTIDPNTNAGLMAEEWWGSKPAGDPFVFVTAGSGIGAAIKVDGRLMRGVSNEAGQFGHILIDPNGPKCGCGRRGCLETLASASATLRLYRNLHHQAGSATRTTRARRSIQALVAASHDDPLATEALHQVGDHLGDGLVSLVNLVNPQVIVLGGELMDAHAIVLPRVRQAVQRHSRRFLHAVADVECSIFTDQAPLVGAATLAFEQLFEAPLVNRPRIIRTHVSRHRTRRETDKRPKTGSSRRPMASSPGRSKS